MTRFTASRSPRSTPLSLIEMCENLKKGVPIATPVFDGARMADIEGMLTRAGLNTSGQVVLTDGRTGETVRAEGDGWLYLHAEAASPG